MNDLQDDLNNTMRFGFTEQYYCFYDSFTKFTLITFKDVQHVTVTHYSLKK